MKMKTIDFGTHEVKQHFDPRGAKNFDVDVLGGRFQVRHYCSDERTPTGGKSSAAESKVVIIVGKNVPRIVENLQEMAGVDEKDIIKLRWNERDKKLDVSEDRVGMVVVNTTGVKSTPARDFVGKVKAKYPSATVIVTSTDAAVRKDARLWGADFSEIPDYCGAVAAGLMAAAKNK
jgi:hypothetical protein